MRAAVRRAVLWRTGVQLGVQIVTWASTLAVIRLLAPADYGLMAMAQLVVALLSLLAGQGIATAAVAAPSLDRADVARLFGLQLILGVALAVAQAALSPLAAAWFGEPRVAAILVALAPAYPLATVASLPAALRQRAMDFRTPAMVEGGTAIVQAGVTLILALLDYGVWALALGQLAGSAARLAGWLVAGSGLPLPSFRLAGAGVLLRAGSVLTVNGLLFYALTQAPVLIGGRMTDAAGLGLYATAFFLASIPAARFLPALSEVGLASYAQLRTDREALARSFRLVARVVALASFPLYLGLAATAPDAAPVLLGRQWSGAAPLLVALGLAMPAYTLFCLFGPPAYALGRNGVQTAILIFSLVLMLPAFVWGAIRAESLGLAAAWALAFPVAAAFAAWRTLPVLGVSARALLADFGPPLLAAVLMGALVMALRRALPGPPEVRLALCVATGAGAYMALARLLARRAWEDALNLVRR